MSGNLAGDTADYSCDVGHKLVGDASLECQLGGQWSAPPPECVFVDCGAPAAPANGRVDTKTNGTTFASVASYSCGADYQLEGQQRRVCQEDGTWSSRAPTCQLIRCEEPELPEGGFVLGTDFTVHSEITYHCEMGHRMVGKKTSKCLPTKSWDSPPPTCVCKSSMTITLH